MHAFSESRLFWAILAAIFAALTAIFAKVGVSGVNSNFANFRCFRTGPSDLVDGRGAVAIYNLREDGDLSGAVRPRDWRVMVVLFSRASARQGLAGRTHRQVERCARCHYRCGFSGRKVINDRMERRRFDRARRGSCGLVLICRERGLGTE